MSLEARLRQTLDRIMVEGLGRQAYTVLRGILTDAAEIRRAGQVQRVARRPRSAKAKGHRAVAEVRDMLLSLFPDLHEDDILIQTTSVGGQDLHLSPTAVARFPFAVEVKNVERLNLWAALAQAQRNAVKKGLTPLLFCRRNGVDLHVVIRADRFLALWRR